jgi:hypothetical protein
MVRWRMAILSEPEFFVRKVLYLASLAKNSGWKIALISFVTFLHQGRKVSSKDARLLQIMVKNHADNIERISCEALFKGGYNYSAKPN